MGTARANLMSGVRAMEREQIRLLHSSAELPETSDGAEHCVVGIHVCLPPADDPDDPRFAIGFETASGRVLRVRLPVDELQALGRMLLELEDERCWSNGVRDAGGRFS